MDWLSAITNIVGWFAGTNQKGYGEDPNFTGGGGGSAQTGSGFLGLIRVMAKTPTLQVAVVALHKQEVDFLA